MVESQLTPELIKEGATLIEGLDDAGVSPDAAFWLLAPEISGWKLLIAESSIGPKGPKDTYRLVQKVLLKLREKVTHLSLEDVKLTTPDQPVVQALSQLFSTGPGIDGIRFTQNVINGLLIADAYIYRLRRHPQSKRKGKRAGKSSKSQARPDAARI